MALHENEIPIDEALVRFLVREQCPRWADVPLIRAGAGTDNVMFRLGEDLLVRLPRTPDKARAVAKEQKWLRRLAPLLPYRIPEPVHAGAPTATFPLAWSVYRWIDGEVAGSGTVRDWAAFGADLAGFVRDLHRIDLMGATRTGDLRWYRGGRLQGQTAGMDHSLADCRAKMGSRLDVDELERLWSAALALPGPTGPYEWLHGDLKPSNLLVRNGQLHAVIDFGTLSIGYPDAEHAALWDLPAEARGAYRGSLDLDEPTWIRARAWAIKIGLAGIAYYWESWPEFVAECESRLQAILADSGAR